MLNCTLQAISGNELLCVVHAVKCGHLYTGCSAELLRLSVRNETFMCSISFKFNPLHFIVYPTDFRNQAWYHKLWATVLGWQERWNRCGRHEKEKKSLSTFNCLYFRRLRSKQEKRRAVQRSSRDKRHRAGLMKLLRPCSTSSVCIFLDLNYLHVTPDLIWIYTLSCKHLIWKS